MKQPTKQISVQGIMAKMEEIVAKGLTGCSFAHMRTVTIPKLNKKSRISGLPLNIPASDIRKISTFGCGLGFNYQRSVENKLIAEGKSKDEYERGESWHVPHGNSKVICEHKKTGELYFFVSLNANNKSESKFINIQTGNEISKEEISEFLPPEHEPTNQGTEPGNAVIVRTLKLESLKALSADGESWEII
jgi:hypothetical protein